MYSISDDVTYQTQYLNPENSVPNTWDANPGPPNPGPPTNGEFEFYDSGWNPEWDDWNGSAYQNPAYPVHDVRNTCLLTNTGSSSSSHLGRASEPSGWHHGSPFSGMGSLAPAKNPTSTNSTTLPVASPLNNPSQQNVAYSHSPTSSNQLKRAPESSGWHHPVSSKVPNQDSRFSLAHAKYPTLPVASPSTLPANPSHQNVTYPNRLISSSHLGQAPKPSGWHHAVSYTTTISTEKEIVPNQGSRSSLEPGLPTATSSSQLEYAPEPSGWHRAVTYTVPNQDPRSSALPTPPNQLGRAPEPAGWHHASTPCDSGLNTTRNSSDKGPNPSTWSRSLGQAPEPSACHHSVSYTTTSNNGAVPNQDPRYSQAPAKNPPDSAALPVASPLNTPANPSQQNVTYPGLPTAPSLGHLGQAPEPSGWDHASNFKDADSYSHSTTSNKDVVPNQGSLAPDENPTPSSQRSGQAPKPSGWHHKVSYTTECSNVPDQDSTSSQTLSPLPIASSTTKSCSNCSDTKTNRWYGIKTKLLCNACYCHQKTNNTPRRYGPVSPAQRPSANKICSNCSKTESNRWHRGSLCSACYQFQYRHRTPRPPILKCVQIADLPKICSNCSKTRNEQWHWDSSRTGLLCSACYQYELSNNRHGPLIGPAREVPPAKTCSKCSCTQSVQWVNHKNNGILCNACYCRQRRMEKKEMRTDGE